MSTHEAKPTEPKFTVQRVTGGYVVLRPNGHRETNLIKHWPAADQVRRALQKAEDAKSKRGPRPCMCCGDTFRSEGKHNRMCDKCRKLPDHLGDFVTPHSSRSMRRV